MRRGVIDVGLDRCPPDIDAVSIVYNQRPRLSACQQLEPRDVGGGLSSAVPVGAVDLGGGATANPGPIPAAFSAEFEVDGKGLSIGRWMTPPDVDEADIAVRDDGGATLFVKSPDPALRDCVLAATGYDATADRRD